MIMNTRKHNDVLILCPRQDHPGDGDQELGEAVHLAHQRRPQDRDQLQQVSYLDSSGVGELVAASPDQRQGGELRICGMSSKIFSLIKMTSLHSARSEGHRGRALAGSRGGAIRAALGTPRAMVPAAGQEAASAHPVTAIRIEAETRMTGVSRRPPWAESGQMVDPAASSRLAAVRLVDRYRTVQGSLGGMRDPPAPGTSHLWTPGLGGNPADKLRKTPLPELRKGNVWAPAPRASGAQCRAAPAGSRVSPGRRRRRWRRGAAARLGLTPVFPAHPEVRIDGDPAPYSRKPAENRGHHAGPYNGPRWSAGRAAWKSTAGEGPAAGRIHPPRPAEGQHPHPGGPAGAEGQLGQGYGPARPALGRRG
jgi:hypothetical protein